MWGARASGPSCEPPLPSPLHPFPPESEGRRDLSRERGGEKKESRNTQSLVIFPWPFTYRNICLVLFKQPNKLSEPALTLVFFVQPSSLEGRILLWGAEPWSRAEIPSPTVHSILKDSKATEKLKAQFNVKRIAFSAGCLYSLERASIRNVTKDISDL